jgi:hypothetical protein
MQYANLCAQVLASETENESFYGYREEWNDKLYYYARFTFRVHI